MDNRWFQWIAGEQRGQVLVFDKIEQEDNDVYICFKDGSRINEQFVSPLNAQDLTGKYMAEISGANNAWGFQEEWVGREEERWEDDAKGERVCVQPFIPGRKVIKFIPPRYSSPKTSNFGPVTPQTVYIEKAPEPKIDKTDPVYILMSKSKKSDSDINMAMTVSLPPKSLYDLAKESFEDGDQKFIEYIVEEITVDQIKDALKLAIKQMYEYNGTITTNTL